MTPEERKSRQYERVRQWKAKNKERVKEHQGRWLAANKERRAAYLKAYRAARRDHYNALWRAYHKTPKYQAWLAEYMKRPEVREAYAENSRRYKDRRLRKEPQDGQH